MTYSIVARDPETGEMGVAVQTHQMSVGKIVPWLLPGLGAIATQSLVNISFGPIGLQMLREGVPAKNIIDALVASDDGEHRRQVAVVDAAGNAAAHTGTGCIPFASHYVGDGYSVQANMMNTDTVIPAMRNAFEQTTGALADRLIAALEAAEAEDGDIRGQQSAAIQVVSGNRDDLDWKTLYDLRVDEHASPVIELKRLVRMCSAALLDDEGFTYLEKGDYELALQKWELAREKAPEFEELAFWQAVALADKNPTPDSVPTAASILKTIESDSRWQEWLDLVNRLQQIGLIEREHAGQELLQALNQLL